MTSLFALLALGSAIWVYLDAQNHEKDSPWSWAIAVFLIWPIAFPWYLGVRKRPEYGRCRSCGKKLKPYGSVACEKCGAEQPWADENAATA